MKVQNAFDKIYREHQRVAAILSLLSDYGESTNLDPNMVFAMGLLKEVLQSENEAFEVLDHFIVQSLGEE